MSDKSLHMRMWGIFSCLFVPREEKTMKNGMFNHVIVTAAMVDDVIDMGKQKLFTIFPEVNVEEKQLLFYNRWQIIRFKIGYSGEGNKNDTSIICHTEPWIKSNTCWGFCCFNELRVEGKLDS